MDREPVVSRMDPARERDLVDRARADGSAFGELYDFYVARIYGFILRRVGERSVAEDLTATTFERALGAVRRSDFRNESFGGWLYRVAANAVVDHVRADRRLVPLAGLFGETAGDDDGRRADPGRRGRLTGDEAAVDAFARTLDRDQLARALKGLPETHRRVLVLRFYDDLEVDEICGLLGCSRATFAVKLHRALAALRGALARETTDAA
jgi:RNA polymerase sigma-70 factor (ECF subfamily)